MNTSVDVLAALLQIADGEGDTDVLAMRVHAAVAELIEVARQFESYESADFGDTSILDNEELWDRLSAALARVKGA